jgi:hypothetical protein
MGLPRRVDADSRRSRRAPVLDRASHDRPRHGLRRRRPDQRRVVRSRRGGVEQRLPLLVGIFAGCGAFFFGDRAIARAGGAERKDARGAQEGGSALAIVLGTVLDGIPESMVIGLTFSESGAIGTAYLLAVLISNLPEPTSTAATSSASSPCSGLPPPS